MFVQLFSRNLLPPLRGARCSLEINRQVDVDGTFIFKQESPFDWCQKIVDELDLVVLPLF